MASVSTSITLQFLFSISILAIFVGAVLRLSDYLLSSLNRPPYPPGPKPQWLVGNLHDIPIENVAHEYIKWGKKYNSDILHASALGNHIIILNKREDIEELFEKRAPIYSDRPALPIISLLGWDYNFGLYPYGASLRLHRRICKQNFGQKGVREYYEPIITDRVGYVLRGLADRPNTFDDLCKIFSVSIPLASMYGYCPESLNDPVVSASREAFAIGAALLLPGATLINVFPFLKHIPSWVPGASTHRKADEARRIQTKAHTMPIDSLRARIMKPDGTVTKAASELSLIGRILLSELDEKPVSTEEKQASMNVACTIYSAASDTTSSSTVSFIYLMTINPEVQRKAQAEIDRVVGASRLPKFSDRENLPYVEAIYREVMRWLPPLPMGGPHYLKQDDFYKGYFLPKGSVVLPNLMAICHDEQFYEDPQRFNPDRFFDESGALLESDPHIAFGIGRRSCPGLHLGSASMWLFIATVLACFDIQKAKDDQGHEIEIEEDYIDLGISRHKKHFQCSITPRSVAAMELIKRTAGKM